MQFLPDPFKLEVIKFFDTPAGKALMVVMHARKTTAPDANLPHSTKLSTYDQRAGYENALDMLVKIPHESQQESTPDKKVAILLDTRD